MTNEKLKLNTREAAELIKGMGGGTVNIAVHDDGEISIAAIAGGNPGRAQNDAEVLLEEIQKKYQIVRGRLGG